VKGVLDWRVSNSGIDESFRSPLYLHTLRTAPAQRAAVLAGLGRSLVQIKPPQPKTLSLQQLPRTPQPPELTISDVISSLTYFFLTIKRKGILFILTFRRSALWPTGEAILFKAHWTCSF
jgi:hypothetical protein